MTTRLSDHTYSAEMTSSRFLERQIDQRRRPRGTKRPAYGPLFFVALFTSIISTLVFMVLVFLLVVGG